MVLCECVVCCGLVIDEVVIEWLLICIGCELGSLVSLLDWLDCELLVV